MAAQAGWYPDPSGDATKLRYWNGAQWTDNYADAQPFANPGPGYNAPSYGQPSSSPAYYSPTAGAVNENDRTMRLIAFIFCAISLGSLVLCLLPSFFFTLIPLAWTIPMTIHCWGIYQGTKANTTAFGVCTLIFVSVVGGILLLVSKKDA